MTDSVHCRCHCVDVMQFVCHNGFGFVAVILFMCAALWAYLLRRLRCLYALPSTDAPGTTGHGPWAEGRGLH